MNGQTLGATKARKYFHCPKEVDNKALQRKFKKTARQVEKNKWGSTWDLTEQGVGVFAVGRSHRGVHAGLAVTCWEFRPCVVSTLVVIVLDVKVNKFGEVDAQRATRVVDVLAIQCLWLERNPHQASEC